MSAAARNTVRAVVRATPETFTLARRRAQPGAVYIARLTLTAVFAYLLALQFAGNKGPPPVSASSSRSVAQPAAGARGGFRTSRFCGRVPAHGTASGPLTSPASVLETSPASGTASVLGTSPASGTASVPGSSPASSPVGALAGDGPITVPARSGQGHA